MELDGVEEWIIELEHQVLSSSSTQIQQEK
jgi:hypothetical protein